MSRTDSSRQLRQSKRPVGSKTISLDLLSSSRASSPTPDDQGSDWTLKSLSSKLEKGKIQKVSKATVYLEKHLSLLLQIREKIANDYRLLELSRPQSQDEHVTKTKIVTFDVQKRMVNALFTGNQPQNINAHNMHNVHPSLPPSASTTFTAKHQNISLTRPQTPNLKPSHTKRSNSEGQNVEPAKTMTSLTIWNNVNKFFIVTPTIEMFRTRLQPSEIPDTKIQLGPHYSIGINQKLKQKYKNGNVQLRIPPEIIAESPEGATSIIFHRLLEAFVTLNINDLANNNMVKTENDSGTPLNNNEVKISNKINKANEISYEYNTSTQFPVSVAGASVYSIYPFEQKLMLEVQSLNLIPDASGPKMTDNEVMNEIVQKTQELNEVTVRTNKFKQELFELLKKKEKSLLERQEHQKKWGTVSFKPEPATKKEQKRPKKRDKLA